MGQAPTSNVTKGLIISLLIVLLCIGLYLSGYLLTAWSKYIIYAIFVTGIISSCISYGKQLDGNVTFGNTFAHGFRVTAVVIIVTIGTALLLTALFPTIKENIVQIVRNKIETDSTNKTETEQRVAQFREGFRVYIIAGALLYFGLLGFISSLAGAALTKRKPASH